MKTMLGWVLKEFEKNNDFVVSTIDKQYKFKLINKNTYKLEIEMGKRDYKDGSKIVYLNFDEVK